MKKIVYGRCWRPELNGTYSPQEFENAGAFNIYLRGMKAELELLDTDEIIEIGNFTLVWDDNVRRVQFVLFDEGCSDVGLTEMAMRYENDRRSQLEV